MATKLETGRIGLCGLMPHPPIVVPAVGGLRGAECRTTADACRTFARRLVESRPDRVVLISPHAPRFAGAFGIQSGSRVAGDLGRFGARHAAVDFANDRAFGARLTANCAARSIKTWSMPSQRLDHGAVVPLHFLAAAGYAGPVTVIALGGVDLPGFGRAIRTTATELGGGTAVVASGDLTHRAKPGAPAGFDPRAVEFDQRLIELIRRGDLLGIQRIDPDLRTLAAEDASDTATIAAAAVDFHAHGADILSYEHPFGVGYMVALFDDGLGG